MIGEYFRFFGIVLVLGIVSPFVLLSYIFSMIFYGCQSSWLRGRSYWK